MKIALQWGAPEQPELAQFVQAVGCDLQLQSTGSYEGMRRQAKILAAYDDDRLIAIGAWLVSEAEAAVQHRIVIHPEYESRGVKQHMIKLLQAAKPVKQAESVFA